MQARTTHAASGGIFGHFLQRNIAIQLLSAVLIIVCMLPFFSQWVSKMQYAQGENLVKSLIIASLNDIRAGDHAAVESYSQQLLNSQAALRYIVFSWPDGEDVSVSGSQIIRSNQDLPFTSAQISNNTNATIISHSRYVPEGLNVVAADQFVYSSQINHASQALGRITIGYSNHLFTSLMQEYYWRLLLVLVASFCLGLAFFMFSSRQIRQQVQNFIHTARQLSRGQLTARAPEKAIGELSLLAKSVNKMASNLGAQSGHLNRMAQMVSQTNDAFILFDQQFNLVFANAALQKLTGFRFEITEASNIKSFTDTLNLDLTSLKQALVSMQVNMASNFNQDLTITRKDGHEISTQCRMELIFDDDTDTQHYLIVLSNISERKALEQELHSLAYYDKLTGLPNRRMCLDYLQKRIAQTNRQATSSEFALFFMDLDNFKNINDTMGHEAGDVLLQQIANRLKEIFRDSDLVTRLGGDEFVIVIENTQSRDVVDLAKLANKAIQMLSTFPIFLQGRVLTMSTSLGIATYPDNGMDVDALLKNADTAMYAAKQSGKNNYAFYNETMNVKLREYLEMETDLKAAIQAKDQLQLQYQPIVDLKTKKLVAVEVLARWQHPSKGLVSPAQFIPVAEKTDLILALSEQLLNQAFKQAQLWQARALTHYVSVNISVRQFEKPNFINTLTGLLLDYEVEPSMIQLEFTEGIMLDHSEETFEKFNEIKALGFRIAIDDFGTGYSSLSYIHKLPIDVIKIDQAFVADLLNNEKSQAILAAITQLSNTLNIETVAEGIEFSAHQQLLIDCNCQYGQGYLYDASMLIDQLEDKYMPLFPETLGVVA